MQAKRSIVQVYLASVIFLAMLPAIVLGYLWVSEKYQRFEEQTVGWRDTYVSTRKRLLQQEVERTLGFIEFKRSQVEERLKTDLVHHVDDAIRLVDSINQYNQQRLTRQQILDQVIAVLKPMRFNDGSGFYSVVEQGAGGKVLLNPDDPRLEGGIASELLDAQGRPLSERMSGSIREQGAAFIDYTALDEQGVLVRKLAYSYYYAPLNILIGASDQPDRVMSEVKQEVLERLASIKYDRDKAVLFLMANDGSTLLRPEVFPHSAGDFLTSDGSPMGVSEFLALHSKAAQQPDGGFIEYQWREYGQDNGTPAINFMRVYEPWGWLIGAGFYLDAFEASIDNSRQSLEFQVADNIRKIGAVLCGLLAVVVLFALRLSRITRRSFEHFSVFFHDASRHSAKINQNKLPYREFDHLAADANAMIAQRMDYEKALRESEQRFESALEFSGSFLWQFDVEETRVLFSEGFFSSLGYKDLDHRYVSIDRLITLCHPDDVEKILQGLQLSGLKNIGGMEYRLRDTEGRYHWFLSRGGVVEESTARGQALGIVTEISEQKHLQEQLHEARVIADDANHAKSLFLSSMSHELRTPLNGVLGHVQILQQEEGFSHEQQQQLQQIHGCGLHLLELIDDVLSLSKIDSGRVDCHYSDCNVSELLQDVSDRMRQKAMLKGLACRVDIDEAVPDEIVIDGFKVKQVLVNLMTNAIKFTDSGFVELSVAMAPDQNSPHLLFAVADSGVGINTQYAEKIFEPFAQLDALRAEGSGLGLAICRRLADAMGGALSVESEANKGSVFSLLIPLKETVSEHVAPAMSRRVAGDEVATPAVPFAFGDKPALETSLLDSPLYGELCEAASEGDIEKFRCFLIQADQQYAVPAEWMSELQRCLDNFDLDAAARLLNNMDANEEWV